ncbi:FAD-dependent oxidoreductase [Staphylococcus aureus]
MGTEYLSKAVIITSGTFLRGEIILGNMKYSSGPNHRYLPSITLSDNLRELGLTSFVLKQVHHRVILKNN